MSRARIGQLKTGRPYFVMELVEGVRITEYCDGQRSDTTSRLELFLRVCDAIQHAHQKGVIHRDIKPSNVVVARNNGTPVPKVIDFGIAKATTERLTDQSLHTEHGFMIGTPAYMSPEQIDPEVNDIDTRTDIYSLGVLLYELLVGVLPLDTDSYRRAGGSSLWHTLRGLELPRPSTRLSSLGAAATEVAQKRACDARSLGRQLRGDLDWIVMMCLEKDRDRRYATTVELTDDIQRYLRHEPVSAGPPSAGYRMRKFVRRNRALVLGATVVLAAVVAGTISTGVFAIRESRQRAVAETQAQIAQSVNDFLNEMLASVDPRKAQGRDVSVLRDILAEAAANIETEFAAEPQVESSIRRTIGLTYTNLGLLTEAEVHLERALEIERSLADGPHGNLAELLHLHGALSYQQGRYEEGESLLSEAVDVRRAVLGPTHARLVTSLNKLAMLLLDTGRLDEAKTHLDEALAIVKVTHERDATLYLNVTNTLAGYYGKRGELAEAEALVREGLAAYADKPDHPDALAKLHNLAILLKRQGKFDEAEPLFLEARERVTRVLGSEHQHTLAVRNGLATLLDSMGRHEEAEAIHRDVLSIRRRTLGEKHPNVQSSLNNLAGVLRAQNKLDECISVFRESLALAREIHGPKHPWLALAQGQLGFVLRETGDASNYPESEQLILSALSILEEKLPKNHPYILNTLRGLRRLYAEEAMNDPAKLSAVQERLESLGDDGSAAVS